MTASTLLSIHNIHFLHERTRECRQAIIEGRFRQLFDTMASRYAITERFSK